LQRLLLRLRLLLLLLLLLLLARREGVCSANAGAEGTPVRA
jgi:hypothetical protein